MKRLLIFLFGMVFAVSALGTKDLWLYRTQQAVNLIAQGTDATSSATTGISQEHHEIHEEDHYYISGYETAADGDTINFIVTTPDTTVWAHMTFAITGTGLITVEIADTVSGITGGATVTPINNARNSANVSLLTIVKDPTSIGDLGDVIDGYSVGTAGIGALPGQVGIASRDRELILAQNLTYIIRIISGAADNVISHKGSWYEHENK